jgi:hypothetical protein
MRGIARAVTVAGAARGRRAEAGEQGSDRVLPPVHDQGEHRASVGAQFLVDGSRIVSRPRELPPSDLLEALPIPTVVDEAREKGEQFQRLYSSCR